MPVIILQKLGLQHKELGSTFTAIINKPIKKSTFYNVLENSIRNNPLRRTIIEGPNENKYHSLRILVAEDNAINQKLITRFLQVLGFRGKVVSNGLEVIKTLKQHPYDVVLMDINMPKMDGIEVTRVLRASSEKFNNVYIIGITAGIKNETRVKSQEAGMNDFLSKPITIQDLKVALYKAKAAL